jgi:hypothetical protein
MAWLVNVTARRQKDSKMREGLLLIFHSTPYLCVPYKNLKKGFGSPKTTETIWRLVRFQHPNLVYFFTALEPKSKVKVASDCT